MARQTKMNIIVMDNKHKVIPVKFEAYKDHVEQTKDPELWGAWAINQGQQFKDEMGAEYFQMVDLKNFKPIKVYDSRDGDKNAEEDIKVIAGQTEDEELTFLEDKNAKDGRTIWLGIALALMVLIFGIAILLTLNHRNSAALKGAADAIGFICSSLA